MKEFTEVLNQNISSGVITILSFNKEDLKALKWYKKSEFRFNDNLYDVVAKEYGSDGRIYYYCINDNKEKNLIAQFEKHLSRHTENDSRNQSNEKNLIKNLLKDYYPPENTFTNLEFNFEYSFIEFSTDYISIQTEEPVPPPEISC